MIDFLGRIVTLIYNFMDIIVNTSTRIDSITFDGSQFYHYLGYAHYCMGDTLYFLFTTVILISIGISVWTFLLKGINMLRSVLPW